MKRLLVVAGLFLATANRLPAPISESAETTPTPSAAVSNEDWKQACHIKKGDTLQLVRAFYRLNYDPSPEPHAPGKSFGSTYHFNEYGVWVFFDKDQKVQSLRFEKPFRGKIGGVAVGETRDQVVRDKGPCQNEFRGMPDADEFANRDERIRKLVAKLPDTVPKAVAAKTIETVVQIQKEQPKFNTACSYTDSNGRFCRYDFGSTSGVVQIIFSDHGN